MCLKDQKQPLYEELKCCNYKVEREGGATKDAKGSSQQQHVRLWGVTLRKLQWNLSRGNGSRGDDYREQSYMRTVKLFFSLPSMMMTQALGGAGGSNNGNNGKEAQDGGNTGYQHNQATDDTWTTSYSNAPIKWSVAGHGPKASFKAYQRRVKTTNIGPVH